MMRSLVILVAWLCVTYGVAQQDTVRMRYAATITEQDLREHLTVLASDAYEGREAGRQGQKMAAAYLMEQFSAFGIEPLPLPYSQQVEEGYYQRMDLVVETPGSIDLVMDGETYRHVDDLLYFNERIPDELSVPGFHFAGNGEAANYAGAAVENAVVLVLLNTGSRDVREPELVMAELAQRTKDAERAGVSVLLVVVPEWGDLKERFAHYLTSPRMRLPERTSARTGMQTIMINEDLGQRLLAKGKYSLKKAEKRSGDKARSIDEPLTFTVTPRTETVVSENVLAYIEGSQWPEEVIVVTAHYDHIGMHDGEVYNGADDDGSGTVALLEMAQAFAMAKQEGNGPKRSILFMPVTAEEKGLLGSEYYSEHPVFPLENTVADLNIDMIGRTDSVHAGSEPYVYVIGSDRISTELHSVNEEMNVAYVGLDLDYTFNAEDDPNRFYYRSDHYNFARKGVPSVFYFSGVHEDYHQAGDEVDKIRFDLLQRRTLLVFHTAWELAHRPERIRTDRP